MRKLVTLLKDLDTAEIDAIIISTETTADEIDDFIRDTKDRKENSGDSGCVNFDDLAKCLPADCEVISASTLGEATW